MTILETRREALEVAVREADGGPVHVFGCVGDGLDPAFRGAQWCDRRRDADAPVVFHIDARYYDKWQGRTCVCHACGETMFDGQGN